MKERKLIGYLMGYPIYEAEPGELPEPSPLIMTELTNEIAKRFTEQCAAELLGHNIPTPKEDVKC